MARKFQYYDPRYKAKPEEDPYNGHYVYRVTTWGDKEEYSSTALLGPRRQLEVHVEPDTIAWESFTGQSGDQQVTVWVDCREWVEIEEGTSGQYYDKPDLALQTKLQLRLSGRRSPILEQSKGITTGKPIEAPLDLDVLRKVMHRPPPSGTLLEIVALTPGYASIPGIVAII